MFLMSIGEIDTKEGFSPSSDIVRGMAKPERTDEDRIRLPSVTRVIQHMSGPNPGLERWKARMGPMAEVEADRAAKLGTLVHLRILQQLSDEDLELPPFPVSEYPEDALEICDLAEAMFEDADLDIEAVYGCEVFCTDKREMYCGTYDCAGYVTGVVKDRTGRKKVRLDNALCVCDLKTSPKAYDSHFEQLGAYSRFVPERPENGLIISVCPYPHKNPTLAVRVYALNSKELRMYEKSFLEKVRAWHRKHNLNSLVG
jgi:hypothetical protein